MNQEKSKNKKKIAVITLFSALVLGGVSATAYLMTKPSSNGDRPQHLTTTDSSNGSEVEFVESSDDGSTTSKDKEKSKEKDKEKTSSSSSSDDKKENASSSSQSNHSNRREGATPIDSSRVANTREEGANSIEQPLLTEHQQLVATLLLLQKKLLKNRKMKHVDLLKSRLDVNLRLTTQTQFRLHQQSQLYQHCQLLR